MLTKIINLLKPHKLIIFIVLLGFVLRLVNIKSVPSSLNWDEVSHGYNAYSILKTGSDEWGETFPVILRAYGDYKLPVYIYTTIISIAVFGLNTFAVRLPSVIAGTGTVIFTYFLTLELLKLRKHKGKINNKTPALFASLLVAVEPWSLFLSRGAFEANFALFLFVAAVYFFLRSFQIPKNMLVSALLFGLTVWTYNSYRIFTPLMLLVFIYLFRSKILKLYKNSTRIILGAVVLLTLFFVPMALQFSTGEGQARYEKVAIIDEGAINKINEQRNQSDYPPFVKRAFYNRPVFFTKTAFNNWVQHFSLNFLFIEGGDQYQYSVQNHGLIYLINLPFMILGVIFLLREALTKREKYAVLILAWIVLAPLPASITRDSPHALRTITILPMPMIVSAVGLVWFVIKAKKLRGSKMDLTPWTWPRGWEKWIISREFTLYLIYILILTILVNSYLVKYFSEYRNDFSWAWQYGYQETVDFVKENYDEYEKIIYTKKYGEPHIFLLFYWPWDPDDFRNDPNLIRFEQSEWFWVDRFDKFYFVNDWEIPKRSDQDFVMESGEEFDCDFSKCLLVTSPGTVQHDWELLETIYFLDNEPAFEIYDN